MPGSGTTTSIWMATAEMVSRHPLINDAQADVCIIGAGVAGLTTAYLLARQGRSVVVLEDGAVASGETSRTTAHLSNAIDGRYEKIEKIHGPTGAQMAAQSHSAAIDRIEANANEEGIECDFHRVDGYLFLPPEGKIEELERELAAAHRAGLTEVEMAPRAPWPSYDTGQCLRWPRQGQIHALKYINGLMEAVERHGGRIFTQTHAQKIQGGSDAHVETANGMTVRAGAIVVATNTPVNDMIAIHTKQAPYRTYVIGARIPKGSVPRGLYWDTLDPYHFVRLQQIPASTVGEGGNGQDILIIGGEDHKTGQADDGDERWRRLEAWARERFPMIQSVEFHWSGQVMETMDGLAFIGQNPGDAPNVYIATGDSGMGMTHGTIAGMILTDLIEGRSNSWAAAYSPDRVRMKAMPEFIKENINFAAQYTDYLTGGDVKSADRIAPGSGAVIRQGLKKVAAYRDEEGDVYERSAACPHVGCPLTWNSTEKSWDCPCHGSRFDPFGRVLNGPANRDLRPAQEEPATKAEEAKQ